MNLYRMALTEAGLAKGFLRSIGIPEPSNTYKAYSSQLPKSTGGQKRTGYKNDTWQWISITPTQANEICELVESALSGDGVLYVTLPRANGENAGQDWIDAYGVPSDPEIEFDHWKYNVMGQSAGYCWSKHKKNLPTPQKLSKYRPTKAGTFSITKYE